ncbi:MAG TPA: aldo/keto reductase [Steroidobacter sp.]|jgi:aryl-alcohol dehydrogenase-like predicted oxidoreductase|nr:aldo/keto reductase [Steroidobacter sp.]
MAGLLAGAAAATWWASRPASRAPAEAALERGHEPKVSGMRLRELGRTGLTVSEVGFGAWAIGGQSYGVVEKSESLRALARAEELGCNFVDTAAVYGESERIIGEFLSARRSRWIVSTKYSGQPAGLAATVERQLKDLGTDYIDLYQIHWFPRGKDAGLLEQLSALKRSGKARFVGLSLYTAKDVEDALEHPEIDGFMLAFNLLEPDPFMSCLPAIRAAGKAVIIRSALREGFLAGKFKRDATFQDPTDQRRRWSREQIARTVEQVELFRFLETDAGSMVAAAVRYPLSFPEVSTVAMGTKSVAQAESNFGLVPGAALSPESLERIRRLQIELGLGDRWMRIMRRFGLRR